MASMKKIEAIIRPERLEAVKVALVEAGITGLHVENVVGHGNQRGVIHSGRGGGSYVIDMLPKVKLVTVISDHNVERVIAAIIEHARTGNIGDGKIFISDIADAIRVRTGERGNAVL